MRIVINKCYGGFRVSDACAKKLCIDPYDSSTVIRTSFGLICAVLDDAHFASGRFSSLRVVNIPDEATDYEINEYDGLESITYVLDGKLYHL